MAARRPNPNDGIAWVTGASSGIGRAVVLELVRRGWPVAATARRQVELDELATEAPGKVFPFAGDVTDRAGMASMVGKIEAEIGPIALGFLNVGTFFPDKPGEMIGDAFRRTYEVNLGGTINAMEPILAGMRARGLGQIAVVASVAGYGGLPRATAYSSSKAALIAMCESLKFALDPMGITIQVVCPGFVKTPLTDKNDFPMPFLIEADEAARRICDGLETGGFEIAFPRRMAWLLKALNYLPYRWYFGLVGRGTAARA